MTTFGKLFVQKSLLRTHTRILYKIVLLGRSTRDYSSLDCWGTQLLLLFTEAVFLHDMVVSILSLFALCGMNYYPIALIEVLSILLYLIAFSLPIDERVILEHNSKRRIVYPSNTTYYYPWNDGLDNYIPLE